MYKTSIFKVIFICFLFTFSSASFAATFNVDSLIDEDDAKPGDGFCLTVNSECTLRAAVMEANALANSPANEPDKIILMPHEYIITQNAVVPTPFQLLASDTDTNLDLDITEDVIIIGAGSRSTIINAQDVMGIFEIHEQVQVSLLHLTLKGGNPTAIYGREGADLFLFDCNVQENQKGVYSYLGSVNIDKCSFLNNKNDDNFDNYWAPDKDGAAINIFSPFEETALVVQDSFFTNNSTQDGPNEASTIVAYGTSKISNSIFHNNVNEDGCGPALIFVGSTLAGAPEQTLTFEKNTVSNNQQGVIVGTNLAATIKESSFINNTGACLTDPNYGGAGLRTDNTSSRTMLINSTFYNNGGHSAVHGTYGFGSSELIILNTTIVGNHKGLSGGAKIRNSIIAENTVSDCHHFSSLGHNFIGDTTGCMITILSGASGDLFDLGSPNLMTCTNNGIAGEAVCPPKLVSYYILNNADPITFPDHDQLGRSRMINPPDIGAVEYCDDADHDGDGFTLCGGDCHDFDSDIYPGAEEICDNSKDDDCDGQIDEGFMWFGKNCVEIKTMSPEMIHKMNEGFMQENSKKKDPKKKELLKKKK